MTGPPPAATSHKGKEICWLVEFQDFKAVCKELSALTLSNRLRVTCPDSISFFFHSRVKHNSESERRSPSSEDDRDEKESRAEIQNQEDYKEIFQPKNAICQYQGLLCF